MKYTAFCTEGMAKSLHFLPVEMAPGHLIDSREIHAAIRRLQAATAHLQNINDKKFTQLELF